MLVATTHEGALTADALVFLPLRSWPDHIRVSRLHASSLVPGPLILLCLSELQPNAVLFLGTAHPRVFVTTRACTDTMPLRGTDDNEDELTEADNTAVPETFGCASICGTRQTPSACQQVGLKYARSF
jgi:hypothetical protein